MKPTQKNKNSGFTLIELIVVIAILGMTATLVVVNFNRLRAERSVILAQNEMVTQIRKVQSYALSGKDSTGSSAFKPRFFMVTFQQNQNFYNIAEIYEASGSYGFNEFETVRLNEGAIIQSVSVSSKQKIPDQVCTQVLFSVPYGKTYIYSSDDVCDDAITTTLQDPLQLSTLANRNVSISIYNPKTATTKSVTVLGVTGRVEGN